MINSLELGYMMQTGFNASWIPHRKEWRFLHGDRRLCIEYKLGVLTKSGDSYLKEITLTERLLDAEDRWGNAKTATRAKIECDNLDIDNLKKQIAITLIDLDFSD